LTPISRRLGHANPAITLSTHGRPFKKNDGAAAGAIEAAMYEWDVNREAVFGGPVPVRCQHRGLQACDALLSD
jgi:hypothetical protein